MKVNFRTLLTLSILLFQAEVLADELYQFEIPSQTADASLIEFADQTNLTVAVPFDTVSRIVTSELKGKYTIQQALDLLLKGTDLGATIFGRQLKIFLKQETRGDSIMKKNKLLKHSVSSLTAAAAIVVGGQASAETSVTTLEEVIVTAQKRESSIQDVPLAISALTGRDLSTLNVGGDDVRMLAARVPNLNIESTFGRSYPRFYVRGQGNVEFRLNATQPVGTYYDEVVLENAALRGMPIFDMERIEVLSGPQGTLWGKNTTGGAIHFISKKPSAEQDGYARVTLGNLGLFNVEGAVGGELNDQLAGRLSVLYQSRDGWVTNTVTGNDLDEYEDFAIRGQLLWTPSDKLEGLFRVHARSLDGTATLFNANANDAFDKDQISLESDNNNGQEVDQLGFSANISYDMGNVTLTSITAFETGELFSSGDLDGSSVAANSQVNFADLDNVDQITQELRLTSNNDGPLNWQAGLFYYEDDMSYTDTGSNLTSFGNHISVNADSQSEAVYGHLTYDVSDKLTLSGGLRYTKVDAHLDHALFYFGPNPSDPLNPNNALFTFDIPFLGAPTASADNDSSEVTGDVSFNYQASDNVNWFGRIAKGFRAGTIDGNASFTPTVETTEPETVISFETGIKSDLLNNRLRLNATVFYYDYEDQQIFSFTGVNNAVALNNAKGGTGKGIELDIKYLITDNFKLSFNYGYLDTEYEGPTFVNNGITGEQVNIDGNPFPNSPKNTASLVLDYNHPLSNGNEVYFSTDWAYRSDVNFATYPQPILTGRSYAEGGVRAGYRVDDWDVALWGRNITDVEELTGYTTFTGVGVYTGPRTYGIDVTYRF